MSSDTNGLYQHEHDTNSRRQGLSLVTETTQSTPLDESMERTPTSERRPSSSLRRPSGLYTPPQLITPTFESPTSNSSQHHSYSGVAHLPSPLVAVGKKRVPLRTPLNEPSQMNSPIPTMNIKKLRNNNNNDSDFQRSTNGAQVRIQSEFSSDLMNGDYSSIKPTSRMVTLPSGYQPPVASQSRDVLTSILVEQQEEEDRNEDEEIRTYKTYDITTGYPTLWQCSEEIGSGTFSKVYITTNKKIAIKVSKIPRDDDNMTIRIASSLLRELEILKEMKQNHPNIVELLGYNDDSEHGAKVIMAMPFYEGGDLFSFILNNASRLTSDLIAVIFANIVSGVRFLHLNNIVHRDLKLENVLLRFDQLQILSRAVEYGLHHEPIAILIDFGLSRKIDPENPMLTTRCGSDDYVSPELLLGQEYDGRQNDVWSLGVLLYTILESRLPFDPLPVTPGFPIPKHNKYKPSHRIASISWSWYHLKDTDVDENGNDWKEAKSLVERCLVKRTRRADINELYLSPWISRFIT